MRQANNLEDFAVKWGISWEVRLVLLEGSQRSFMSRGSPGMQQEKQRLAGSCLKPQQMKVCDREAKKQLPPRPFHTFPLNSFLSMWIWAILPPKQNKSVLRKSFPNDKINTNLIQLVIYMRLLKNDNKSHKIHCLVSSRAKTRESQNS